MTARDRRLRVLIVGVNYAPEKVGIGPYTSGLAEGLAAQGHQVRVITSYPHFPGWRVDQRVVDSASPTVEVTRVRHYTPRNPTLLRRVLFELAFGARAAVQRWGRPDVVLAPSPALFATALVVAKAKLRRLPVGVIVQDLYGVGVREATRVGPRTGAAISRIEARTLASATAVSVIHENFVASLHRQGYTGDRTRVIRNWVHTAPAGPLDVIASRAALGWGPDEIIVLHTGSMGAKQGLGAVVDAARHADRLMAPVRFVLMGDGPAKAGLQRAAAGVHRVQFMEPVDKATYSDVLASADLLLVNELPGVGEMAVPSKLTSYFFAGKPVIAATGPHGVTAQEIALSGGGVVTPPGSPEKLLDAALELASDPGQAARIGSAGRAYAAARLSAEKAVAEYDAWCREISGADG